MKEMVEEIVGKHSIVYSPSSIVSIFNAATLVREEKKVIRLKGIFIKEGKQSYNGTFYNRLKDEVPKLILPF